jgi:hypothetical protein
LFRSFIVDLWYEHKTEVFNWEKRIVNYTMETWYTKNKWFLKREFKKRKNNV